MFLIARKIISLHTSVIITDETQLVFYASTPDVSTEIHPIDTSISKSYDAVPCTVLVEKTAGIYVFLANV